MKVVKEVDLEHPIRLGANDSLTVSYHEEEICTVPVGNPMLVDRVVIYEIQNEFGFKTGLAAILGEKN